MCWSSTLARAEGKDCQSSSTANCNLSFNRIHCLHFKNNKQKLKQLPACVFQAVVFVAHALPLSMFTSSSQSQSPLLLRPEQRQTEWSWLEVSPELRVGENTGRRLSRWTVKFPSLDSYCFPHPSPSSSVCLLLSFFFGSPWFLHWLLFLCRYIIHCLPY